MYVDSSWGYAQIGEVDANAANFTVTEALPTTMGTNGKGNSLRQVCNFVIRKTHPHRIKNRNNNKCNTKYYCRQKEDQTK